MDAPPTGRIGRFLNVTSEVSGLARVGPIRGHADTVQKVIRSPETAVHFVTVLEEMPVQETLDGIAELRRPAGRGHPDRRDHDQHGPAARAARGADPARPPTGRLDDRRAGPRPQGGRAGRQPPAWPPRWPPSWPSTPGPPWARSVQRARLAEPGQPCYELPWISDGMDLAGLYRLAAALRDQGAA